MDARLPLDKEVLDRTPPEVIRLLSELLDRIEVLQARIQKLEAENAALKAQLKQNSSNSSKPPSSDPIGHKRRPPEPPSGRARGGQPGHPRHERPLAPPEEVNEVVECRPAECEGCGATLTGNDPEPERRQVAELPPFQPCVTEYRLHALVCDRCGRTTQAELPEGVPTGAFAPRLAAVMALLSGAYRLSKRQIRELAGDLFGLSISTGMLCKLERKTAELLEPVTKTLVDHVRTEPAGVDETGWCEDKQKAWLWVATTSLVTVFRIAASRGAEVVQGLLGEAYRWVVTCDRYRAYRGLRRLQWCWAHLRRDFQAMIDRGGAGKTIGEALLQHSHALFEWWHRLRDGTLSRAAFQKYVGWLRPAFRQDLEAGAVCGCARTAATCRDLLEHEPNLWTFVWREGVEPTNNRSERALRHAVIWRRSSGGTDSGHGSRFVERILSVVATCRQQRRNLLQYLTTCHQRALDGRRAPSLLPTRRAAACAA